MGKRNGTLLFCRGTESLDWSGSSMPPWTAEYIMQHTYYAQNGGGAWIMRLR